MNFDPENKGRGSNDNDRLARVALSKAPDGKWDKPTQLSTPGIEHDVWKRYTDSRLRAFGAR